MAYNISIGILAHNAAATITTTLKRLRRQSLFYLNQTQQYRVEIVVIAYGCTDATAAMADRIFAQTEWQDFAGDLTCLVCELPSSDKSNAWNHYIHTAAAPGTNYFVLMPADIRFGGPATIERMIQNLIQSPQAWMAVDLPVKDVQTLNHKTWREVILASLGRNIRPTQAITHQLYCGRAHRFELIWLPQGLTMGSSFLRTMILTDRFISAEDHRRIVFTPGASHIYRSAKGLRQQLHAEKQMIIGTILNQFICDYLGAICNPSLDAGMLIRWQNTHDPTWIYQLIKPGQQSKGLRLLHHSYTFRRFQRLKYTPSRRKQLKALPLVAAASIADWLVLWRANQVVQRHL